MLGLLLLGFGLFSSAYAETPTRPAESRTRSVEKTTTDVPEIVYLPAGAVYRIGELERPVLSAHWLLPDGHYRKAITLARTLEIVEPALEQCVESNTKLRAEVVPALEGARQQLDVSAARLAAEREKTMRAKQSVLRAWSITAGVLVGAGAAYLATR